MNNKIELLFSLVILIGVNSFAQELTCKDFKYGTFLVPKESKNESDYKIIRLQDTQTEIVEISGQTLTLYGNIEWINDCSYILKYDGSKMELPDELKYINENGGIVTELIKIENNCFYYKSVLIVDGKESKRIDGKFCKE